MTFNQNSFLLNNFVFCKKNDIFLIKCWEKLLAFITLIRKKNTQRIIKVRNVLKNMAN